MHNSHRNQSTDFAYTYGQMQEERH